jgi:copper transport protein
VRRLTVAVVAVGLVLGAGVAFATPASAHAELRSSDPANGELLDTAPDHIRLTFTEPPDVGLTTVRVVDASGEQVPTGQPETAPGSNTEILVRLEPVPDGVYTVTWRTVSATDGHVTAGAFTFGVGVSQAEVTPVPQGQTQTPPPSALGIAGRWLLFVGLVVLLGAGVTALVAFGSMTNARPWLLATAWLVAALGVVAMTLAERSTVGVSLGTLLSSEAGGKYVLLAASVGVVGVAGVAASLSPSRLWFAALGVTAAGAMLARALGGHAAGSVLEVTLQWLHFVGVGAWIGGLAWLVLGLVRRLEPAQVRRFSNLAAVGLGVVVVSGVLRSVNEMGGWGWWLHPFEDDYSTTLIVKLAIVVPLITLGAMNRFRNVARLEDLGSRPLLRTAGAELGLAVAIFASTAVLTGFPPQPNAEATHHAARPLVVRGSDFATTTRVTLTITPGTVGPNTFAARVTDYDTGEPVDARAVSLTFELPDQPEVGSTLELKHAAHGTWEASGTELAQNGMWTVTTLVESARSSVQVQLHVTPRQPQQHVEVSRVEGQPDLYTITLADGMQIQSYVDPGQPGRTNQVHVTAFDPDGKELPLKSATIMVTPPTGAAFEPDMLRFGPGHFAANIDLTAGRWSFDIDAHARDGSELVASFQQTFGG